MNAKATLLLNVCINDKIRKKKKILLIEIPFFFLSPTEVVIAKFANLRTVLTMFQQTVESL